MRVTTVKSARKAQGSCGSCGAPIRAGDGYRWIKFRRGGRRVRCLKPQCMFRRSDMTSSDKLGSLYRIQEDLEDAAARFDGSDVDDIKGALEEAASGAREVGEEYRESATNMEEYFSGSSQVDEINEKADLCDEWADLLEGVEVDDFVPDEDEDASTKPCPTCAEERAAKLKEINAVANRPPVTRTIKARDLKDGDQLIIDDDRLSADWHPNHRLVEVANLRIGQAPLTVADQRHGRTERRDVVVFNRKAEGSLVSTWMVDVDDDVVVTDLIWHETDRPMSTLRHAHMVEWRDSDGNVVAVEPPKINLDCETCGGTGRVERDETDDSWVEDVRSAVQEASGELGL